MYLCDDSRLTAIDIKIVIAFKESLFSALFTLLPTATESPITGCVLCLCYRIRREVRPNAHLLSDLLYESPYCGQQPAQATDG